MMARTRISFTLASFIMLSIALVYGMCASLIKIGLQSAPPLLFGTLRAFLAAALLLVWILLTRQRFLPTRTEWLKIVTVGIAATTIGYGMMFISPGRTSAGIASVLSNQQPLFTVVLAAMFLNEHPRRKDVVALLLGLAGVALVSIADFSGRSAYGLVGAGAALLASAGAAAGNVLMKRRAADFSVTRVTAWQLFIGAVPLWLWSSLAEKGRTITWSLPFVGILLFLAVIGTAIPTVVWFYLIQSHPVGKLSLFFFLVPVFGLLIASLIFGEPLRGNEVVGLGFMVLGVLLVAVNNKGQTA